MAGTMMQRKNEDERFVELGTRLPRKPRMDLYTRAREAGVTLCEYAREVLMAHLQGPALDLRAGKSESKPATKQPAKKSKKRARKKGAAPDAPSEHGEEKAAPPGVDGAAIPFPDEGV